MRSPFRVSQVLTVFFLILLLLMLAACMVKEEATLAAPTAPGPVESTAGIPTEMPEVVLTTALPGQKVLESEHFAYYVENGYRPVDIERFATAAEDIYGEMITALGAEDPGTIILSFQPPEEVACRARGRTFIGESDPRITIFADEQTGEAQIMGVLAHEVIHLIHAYGFDRPLGGDPNLTEGLATWASRDYWTAWHQANSVDEMVRGYLATGNYQPLAEADVFSVHPQTTESGTTNCLARRDLIYSEWAAFVGYLVDVYGWEMFVELMASAASEVTDEGVILPSPTDYNGVYHKSMEALESEWLAHLEAGS